MEESRRKNLIAGIGRAVLVAAFLFMFGGVISVQYGLLERQHEAIGALERTVELQKVLFAQEQEFRTINSRLIDANNQIIDEQRVQMTLQDEIIEIQQGTIESLFSALE